MLLNRSFAAQTAWPLEEWTRRSLQVGEEQQRAIALYVMTNTRSCRRWVRTAIEPLFLEMVTFSSEIELRGMDF